MSLPLTQAWNAFLVWADSNLLVNRTTPPPLSPSVTTYVPTARAETVPSHYEDEEAALLRRLRSLPRNRIRLPAFTRPARTPPPRLDPQEEELAKEHFWTPLNCRILLLKIVYRAQCDWVVYRGNRDPKLDLRAKEAYYWLFLEKPGTACWQHRERHGHIATAFLTICDYFDQDPEITRKHTRTLTREQVLFGGRPPGRVRRREDRHDGSEDSPASLRVALTAAFPDAPPDFLFDGPDHYSTDEDVSNIDLFFLGIS